MQLFTFWSFAPLTYVEHLCLKSMVAAGHPVDLYTYDDTLIVPEGVTVRDAAKIMPRERVIFYHSGSPALFANLFRYAGLRRSLGTWVDADVLLLHSIADRGDHIFGRYENEKINNAILRLPPNCPFFGYIDRLANARVPIPAQWPLRKKLRQIGCALIGRHRGLERLGWGVTGPEALTYYATRNGLARLAEPVDVFYPVHWREAAVVFDPMVKVEDRFTARTRAIHLWNNLIREHKLRRPPRGSFIERMCERYGIS